MMRLACCAALFSLTLTLVGCGKKHTAVNTAPAATPPVVVKAGDLLKEYAANGIAADAKYKGKLVQVSGKFGATSKVPLKGWAVQVLPEDGGEEGGVANVECFLLESAQADVGTLKQGDPITLQGLCDGQVALGQVVLSRCSVVK
jgi:hypothetical protein